MFYVLFKKCQYSFYFIKLNENMVFSFLSLHKGGVPLLWKPLGLSEREWKHEPRPPHHEWQRAERSQFPPCSSAVRTGLPSGEKHIHAHPSLVFKSITECTSWSWLIPAGSPSFICGFRPKNGIHGDLFLQSMDRTLSSYGTSRRLSITCRCVTLQLFVF